MSRIPIKHRKHCPIIVFIQSILLYLSRLISGSSKMHPHCIFQCYFQLLGPVVVSILQEAMTGSPTSVTEITPGLLLKDAAYGAAAYVYYELSNYLSFKDWCVNNFLYLHFYLINLVISCSKLLSQSQTNLRESILDSRTGIFHFVALFCSLLMFCSQNLCMHMKNKT